MFELFVTCLSIGYLIYILIRGCIDKIELKKMGKTELDPDLMHKGFTELDTDSFFWALNHGVFDKKKEDKK